jgi:hypothetical protein
VADPENLRLAFWKSSRGKNSRREVADYRLRLDENLERLHGAIRNGTVEVGRYRFFTVHDPKERLICAAHFEERVLHHALMNVCEPVFERRLIPDSYACRCGKGRSAALARARWFAGRFEWYLKLDVRKYFESVAHEVANKLLAKVLKDQDLLVMFRKIIASYSAAPGRGLPIGNLTSQHVANLYLGELDHFVKETLRAKGYVRYMDDFVLWAADKATLRGWWVEVERFARERLRLELKPPQINRVERGMPFLGTRLDHRGWRLDVRGRRRFAAGLRALEDGHLAGVIGARELQERATAMVAHTEASGGRAFRRSLMERNEFGAAAMEPAAGSNRVLRGGNWNNNANNCRVANRNNNNPSNTNNIGFRSVRSSEGLPQRRQDSDPAAVPSAAFDASWQTANSRPGLVDAAETVPSVPGGMCDEGEFS